MAAAWARVRVRAPGGGGGCRRRRRGDDRRRRRQGLLEYQLHRQAHRGPTADRADRELGARELEAVAEFDGCALRGVDGACPLARDVDVNRFATMAGAHGDDDHVGPRGGHGLADRRRHRPGRRALAPRAGFGQARRAREQRGGEHGDLSRTAAPRRTSPSLKHWGAIVFIPLKDLHQRASNPHIPLFSGRRPHSDSPAITGRYAGLASSSCTSLMRPPPKPPSQ